MSSSPLASPQLAMYSATLLLCASCVLVQAATLQVPVTQQRVVPGKSQGKLPSSLGINTICKVMCARQDIGCPGECSLRKLGYFNNWKRTLRNFRPRTRPAAVMNSFDDVLFNQLLGKKMMFGMRS